MFSCLNSNRFFSRFCLFLLCVLLLAISNSAYAENPTDLSEAKLEEMSYSGYSESENLSVTPIPLSECKVVYFAPDRNYTGTAMEPDKPRIIVSEETMRKHGIPITDYYGQGFELPSSSIIVSYKNNVDAGMASMIVSVSESGFNRGGYLGEAKFTGSREINFNILSAHIANADARGLSDTTTTDNPKEVPVLTFKGKTLQESVDYTLEYHNADRPGTAWLNIKGIGNFYGDSWWMYTISLNRKNFSGSQRYETCQLINKEELNLGSVKGVIVASGDDGRYPDALCASGLSGLLGYPIVLVNGSGHSLDSYSKASLNAFSKAAGGNISILIVGGTSAVSKDIESQLSNFGHVSARLGGATRYETSVQIYNYGKKLSGWSRDHVIVARGDNFADSLSIAPFACSKKVPILLVSPSDREGKSLSGFLVNHKEAVIVGGESAVSKPLFERVKSQMGGKALRLAGSTRYETSAAIVTWELKNGLTSKSLGFARGDSFPDSLAASYYLAQKQSPLLLIDGRSANGNSSAKKIIDSVSTSVGEFNYFGGTNSITNDVRDSLESRLKGQYGWTSSESGNSNTVCTICGYRHSGSVQHDHIIERCPSCGYLGNSDSLWCHLKENAFELGECRGGNFGNSGNESINSNHRTYFG